MKQLSIDFETFSEADIKKLGAAAYAAHPSTEVLCMGYSIDGATPKLWLPHMPLPDFVNNPNDYHWHAWNSFFEMCIIISVLKWPLADIDNWTDTAALARAQSLPRALGKCGEALGLPQDALKDKRGSYLIQHLCKPYKGEHIDDEALLQELYDYCLQDVIAEQAIAKELTPLNAFERHIWELDQIINLRGVPVDVATIDDAMVLTEQVTDILENEVISITNGALSNLSQLQKVHAYFVSLNYPLENLTAPYLNQVLKNNKVIPLVARQLIEIRLQLGKKSSTAKYDTLKCVANSNGRAYGMFMYHGASTGRWTSPTANFQNLPRNTLDDVGTCVAHLKTVISINLSRTTQLQWRR